MTLGELFATGARDVPVWSLDDSLRYLPRTMTHVFATGRRQVFELRLASGKTVRATANHPMLTYDGWRPLGELRRGLPDRRPAARPGADGARRAWADDEVVLLGHLLGDGSFVRRQPLRYASVDEANLEASLGRHSTSASPQFVTTTRRLAARVFGSRRRSTSRMAAGTPLQRGWTGSASSVPAATRSSCRREVFRPS